MDVTARARLHPFLDHPRPVAIAHRGGAGEAPENTLPAFAAAVALGYTHVETDVHLTRDGVLVAFHDAALDRVTDGTGAIADLTLAEVQAADAGATFTAHAGGSFPFRGRGVTVPRLEELLTEWPELYVNIDPKSDACVAPLAALLDRLGAWIGSAWAPSPTRACAACGPSAAGGRARRWARGPSRWPASRRSPGACRVRAPTASRSRWRGTGCRS